MRCDRRCGAHPDPKVEKGIAVCPVDLGTGGFSLLELLWVLMITSVLVSMAWPSSDQLDRGRVRRAADRYVSVHRLARSTGIQHGVMGELHIDTLTDRFGSR